MLTVFFLTGLLFHSGNRNLFLQDFDERVYKIYATLLHKGTVNVILNNPCLVEQHVWFTTFSFLNLWPRKGDVDSRYHNYQRKFSEDYLSLLTQMENKGININVRVGCVIWFFNIFSVLNFSPKYLNFFIQKLIRVKFKVAQWYSIWKRKSGR